MPILSPLFANIRRTLKENDMSNQNNLEQEPHYDEAGNTIHTDDELIHNETQLTHNEEDSQGILSDNEHAQYQSTDDANLNETIIVPGDSAFDPKLEASGLEEDTTFGDDSVSESADNELQEEEAPAMPVDITILNEDYTIFCPQGEEDELFAATHYINEFIDGIREDVPTLSQKNLLVLACLNLYEKMKQATVAAQSDEETLMHASRLVDQMIDDMQLED